MSSGHFYFNFLVWFIPILQVSGWFLLLPSLIEISFLFANSIDSDQTPRSAASDLGLYCLLMSLLWVNIESLLVYIFCYSIAATEKI